MVRPMNEDHPALPRPCDLLVAGAAVLSLDDADRVIGDGAMAVANDHISAVAVARIRSAGYGDVNAATVLRWATTDGAAALGLGGVVGALAPGHKADMLLLEDAPNLCLVIDGPGIVVHSGCGANVHTVVVDGRVVLEDRRPVLFDGAEVVAGAQAVADRLWRASGQRIRIGISTALVTMDPRPRSESSAEPSSD